jgi:hypothetical protein
MRTQKRSRETGAITIMVVLLLLVLLTITSLSLSRNSMRTAIASGSVRQSVQAQNVADAGLEWAIYWIADDPNNPAVRPAATGGALALQTSRNSLQAAGDFGAAGATLTSSDFTLPATANASQTFDLTLTYMGQILPYGTSMPLGKSTTDFTPTSLNLWDIRADGNAVYAGGPTFTRRREVWLTLPPS